MWFIAGIIILFALYFSYTLVAPLVAVAAGAVVAGVILIEFAAATSGVFRGTASIDHLHIEPPPAPAGTKQRDPAYRSYFFGPVFLDYSLAVQVAARRGWERSFAGSPAVGGPGEARSNKRNSIAHWIYDTWSSIGIRLQNEPGWARAIKIIASGPMVGGMVGVAMGAAGAAIFATLTSVVFGLLLALTLVVIIVFAGILRLLELAVLQIRGITLECSHCHHRVGSPAYLCPHCPPGSTALHRRLIPSSLGVFSHVCRCGHSLPTLLAQGKWRLPAQCQHNGCEKPLPTKGMTTRTFHIPVVAGREAGKTVFMMAAVASLKSLEQADPPAFEFANPDAEKDYLRAQSVLQRAIESQFELQKDAFSGIASTLPAISVQAFNIYIGPEGSSNRRLVYLYDAAGERYQTSEGVATFRFLGHTEGVVLIVDPFSFEAVRRVVKADVLTGLRHSQADADEVFSRFAQTLRESLGSKTTRKITASLAVVLTKCDGLLAISEVKHPYDELGDAATNRTQRTIRSDAVRSWLESVAGQHGLVTALENTFERYGYFAVSALDAFTVESRASGRTRAMVSNDDTRDPILWLLNKREAK